MRICRRESWAQTPLVLSDGVCIYTSKAEVIWEIKSQRLHLLSSNYKATCIILKTGFAIANPLLQEFHNIVLSSSCNSLDYHQKADTATGRVMMMLFNLDDFLSAWVHYWLKNWSDQWTLRINLIIMMMMMRLIVQAHCLDLFPLEAFQFTWVL